MKWPLHLLAAALLLCFHPQANAGRFKFDHSRILTDFCCYKNYDVTSTTISKLNEILNAPFYSSTLVIKTNINRSNKSILEMQNQKTQTINLFFKI